MRKFGAILLALLVACTLLATAGCGGDGGEAKQRVEAAAEALPSGVETTEMIDAVADLANYAGTASPEYHAELGKVKEKEKEFREKGIKAKLEYKKVQELSGADEYKKLAKIEIENIDITAQWLDSALQFVEKLAVEVNAVGGEIDANTDAELRSDFERVNALLDRKYELRQEADKLMKDMGLDI